MTALFIFVLPLALEAVPALWTRFRQKKKGRL